MFWHHWRKRIQELLTTRAKRNRSARQRHAGFRPLLEMLEKRQMLAVDLQITGGVLFEAGEPVQPVVIASIDATSSNTVVFTLQNVGEASYGTASTSDYLFAGSATGPLTISIAPGQLSASASINALQDSIWEAGPTETVDLSIFSVTGFTGSTNGATASSFIIEDDAPPTVSLAFNTATVSENVGNATITATIDGVSSIDTVIQLDVSGGSAAITSDYTLPVQFEITIPAGQTSGSVAIGIVNDTTSESTESVTVILSSIGPLDVLPNSASSESTLSIIDDDSSPTVNLNLPSASFNEESGTASVVVTLSASLGASLTVPLTFAGTGTFGVDYSAATTSIVFNAGETSASLTLTGLTDTTFEPGETVIVSFDGTPVGTQLGASTSGSMTITDNDSQPTVSLLAPSPNSVSETGSSTTIVAQLSNLSNEDVTVTFSLSGAATNGTDYSVSTTSITIPAGQSTGSITLTGLADAVPVFEANEQAIVEIASVTNGTENGTQSQAITILDQEAAPVLSFSLSDTTVSEVSGAVTLSATITGAIASQDIVVPITLGGTATSGSDYSTTPVFAGTGSATITIPAGQTSGTIVFTSIDDLIDEGLSESIGITVGTIPSNASYNGPTTFAISQIDNEATPSVELSINQSTLSEDGGVATLTAVLSGSSSQTVIINLGLSGTATSSDYTLSANTIAIPAGSLSASIALTTLFDFAIEGTESVIVDITSIDNGAAVEQIQQQVSASIVDLPVTLTRLGTGDLNENGGTDTFVATLGQTRSVATTVSLTLAGTAVSGSDYLISPTTIVIPANSLSGSTSFNTVNDSTFEPLETVLVSMNVAGGANAASQSISFNIIDDDTISAATVTLSRLGPTDMAESASDTIVATLSNAVNSDVTVSLTVTGTAQSNSDYTLTGTTIVIPAGSLTGSITLTGSNDTRDDADSESVIFDITSVSSSATVTENGTQTVTVNILDNDPRPLLTVFSISSNTIAENGGTATITAQIGAVSDLDVTIPLLASGTATSGSDYSLSANSILIPAGATSASITLTGLSDTLPESSETVLLDIGTITNASRNGVAAIQSTISDVALPGVTLTRQGTGDVSENGGTTTFVATLSRTSSQAITVNLGGTGTATSGSDYSLSANSIVIPAGSLSGTVTFTGIADGRFENNETVTMSIVSVTPANGVAASSPATVTFQLANEDTPPLVNISTSANSIAENGGTTTITARLSAVSNLDTTVQLGFGGTASSSDYTFTSNSIFIPAGQTSGAITITGVNDTISEVTESIIVRVDSVTNGTENGVQAVTVNITDDDPAPSVSIAFATSSITERNGTVRLIATLTTVSGQDITIPLSFTGSATAGVDYLPATGSITIPAGLVTGSLTIQSVNDTNTESTETVIANIVPSTNSSYQLSANSSATTSILDDGNGINISVNFATSSQTTTETGGTRSIVVTLSQASATVTNVVVGLAGSATNLSDYSLSSTTISIPAGQLSGSVAMTILTDNIVEDDETVVLTLTAPSGTIAGANTTHTVTILGNIQRSGSTVTVVGTEGDDTFTTNFSSPDVFTVTLRGPGTNGGSVSRTFTTGDVTFMSFDGLGGTDSSTIQGATASESVVMTSSNMIYARTQTSSTTTSPITITTANSENNQFDGDAQDVVNFKGTSFGETFTGSPTSSEMRVTGSNNVNRATKVQAVVVDAGDTNADTANFVDDTGSTTNESLVAGLTQSQYYRTGAFVIVANGFENVAATSNGGVDDVQYQGTTASETFYGLSTHSVMKWASTTTTVIGFDKTVVIPGGGTGTDQAIFVGSTGNDTLTGSYSKVKFSGSGFDYDVFGFDRYYAYSGGGGNDTADLDDSSGVDTFYGVQTGIYLTGATPATQTIFAQGFDSVKVDSNNGNDTALLYDSAGDDTITGSSDSVILAGANYSFNAAGFSSVFVFSGAGRDVATLTDSSGNDTVSGSPESLTLAGAGYSIQLLRVDSIKITASRGGTDSAALSDTFGNDSIFALGGTFQLRSPLSLVQLIGFDLISVDSSRGGLDTRTAGGTDYTIKLTGNWLPF
jgi:hypothetical protein